MAAAELCPPRRPTEHLQSLPMSDQRKNIAEKLEQLRPELVAFLTKLVQYPSLPGHEQDAQHHYASKLRSLGLDTQIVPSAREDLEPHPAFCDDGVPFKDRLNVVGRWRGSGRNDGRTLILNGHMDVVPTGNKNLWAESPWSGLVRDGKLFGRGSCDMKAGLTANVYAVQVLQMIGYIPAADVLLESVIGEESGGVGTLTTIVKGFKADAAIITEPTRLQLCPVQSGALTFRVRVSGRAIHACMKPYGVSALEKFYLVLQSVQELERRRHVEYKNPLYEDPNNIAPVNVGTIHAGDWPSTVPDQLVAEGRFGVLPGESTASARKALASALEDACSSDEWLKSHPPTLEWFEGQFESGQTPQDSAIVQTVQSSHEQIFGTAPAIRGVTYGSDLRLFTNHGSVPAVLYGPGSIEQAHTVNEFVEIDEVFSAARVLAWIITQWCGGEFV